MELIIGIIGFFIVLGAIILYAGICIGRKTHFRFAYRICRPERKVAMLELNCTNEEKIKVTVHPVTSTGTPVDIEDGSLVVSTESGEGTFGWVENEGLSFFLISGANPGDTIFIVSADADLGEGIETISEAITLHVAGAKAVNLGLVAEAPVPK